MRRDQRQRLIRLSRRDKNRREKRNNFRDRFSTRSARRRKSRFSLTAWLLPVIGVIASILIGTILYQTIENIFFPAENSHIPEPPAISSIIESNASVTNETLEVEKWILEYTNEQREMHGKQALKLQPLLSHTARMHSIDMAENDFYSHENLQGEGAADRAKRNGFPEFRRINNVVGFVLIGVGENIHCLNQLDPDWLIKGEETYVQAIAHYFVDGWMNSPGHRKNILNDNYYYIGIGAAEEGGEMYATQNFQ